MTFPLLVLSTLGTSGLAWVFARRTNQYLVATIAASAAILYVHSILDFHYTADDAYISYRYAANFRDGIGLVWNRGEHVEGYTNFLWVVTLAGFAKAGADIVFTGRWLGFGLAVLVSAATYQLVRQLVDAPAGRVAGLVAGLLLAASGAWALWASAGLEGPMFALLLVCGSVLHLRERASPSRLPVSGVVWALVAMTRPDGVLFFAVSGFFKLADASGDPGDPTRPAARIKPLFLWALGFGALFLPYFVWRYQYYGWLFPNTAYTKVGSGLDQYQRGLTYLMMFVDEYGAWALLLTPIAIALKVVPRGPSLYLLGLIAGWIGYVVYVGGDSLGRFRFFVPLLPLYYGLIVASATGVVQAIERDGVAQSWIRGATLAAIVAGALGFTLYPDVGGSGSGAFLAGERNAVHQRAEYGRWLREHVPPDTVFAVIPAGAMPYESRLPAIDMLGLNDEHIAHRNLVLGELVAGHEKYDSAYVLGRHPAIIVLSDGFSTAPLKRADYFNAFEYGLIPAFPDMLNNPQLWRDYEMRSVKLAEGQWLNLFVRHDASAVLAVTQPSPP